MAGEKKETATRDENGVRKQSYKRFKPGRDYEEIETAQAVALCDMMLDGFKRSVADAERGKGDGLGSWKRWKSSGKSQSDI